jgi:hypothetical protein
MANESLPGSVEALNYRRTMLRGLRLASVGLFGVWMLVEWSIWPNGSELLGPLGLIWYGGPDLCTLALCAALLAAIFAFPFRPSALTAIVSFLGLLTWTFFGRVALGIGC